MKNFNRTLILAASAAALLALPALAQDRPHVNMADRADRRGGAAGLLLHCLRGADLTDSQKADIKTILDAARPTVQADAQAIRAARQKLDADYKAGADKSVLGQDYIDMRADVKKIHDDGEATKDQVLAKLTADQKARVQSCLDASKHGAGLHLTELDE